MNTQTHPQSPFPNSSETERLASLYKLGVLDTPSQAEIDALVQFGRKLFTCAVCGLSLVDQDRLWFKSVCGIAVKQVPREVSLCTHTIEVADHYAVENALEHPLHQTNPLVTGGLELRAYLGVPVRGPGGHRVGSFCIIDTVVRKWTDQDIQNAKELAALAEILLRRPARSVALDEEPSSRPGSLNASVFTATWRRNLSEHHVELDANLAKRLGLETTTRVNKDWFTRQVLECDRDMVYAARSRADGVAFSYHLGLHTGEVLQVAERVEMVQDGNALVKIGLMQVASLLPGAVNRLGGAQHIRQSVLPGVNQGRMVVRPDLSLAFCEVNDWIGQEWSAQFSHRLIDLLKPDQISDVLNAMQAVRVSSRPVCLRLELTLPDMHEPAMYNVTLAPLPPGTDLDSHGFDLTYQVSGPPRSPNTLVDDYNRAHARSLEGTAGWIYRESLETLHVSAALADLLGLREGSATLDELLLALERFSSLDCRSTIDLSRQQGLNRRLEFNLELGRQTRWYQLHTTPYYDRRGQVDGFCGFLTDVTETRSAQLEASNSQYAYDLVTRCLSDGVLEFDVEGRLLFLDKFAKQLLAGLEQRLRTGVSVREIFVRLRQGQLQSAVKQMKSKGVSDRLEIYVPETRQYLAVQLIASYQKYLLVLRDISSEKSIEHERQLFESALCAQNVGVMRLQHNASNRKDFSLRYCNQKLMELLSLRVNELGRVNLEWLMHRHLDVRSRRKLFSAAYRAQDVQFSACLYLQPGVDMAGWVNLLHVFNPESSEMDMLVLIRLGA